jgi:hypothetical protein
VSARAALWVVAALCIDGCGMEMEIVSAGDGALSSPADSGTPGVDSGAPRDAGTAPDAGGGGAVDAGPTVRPLVVTVQNATTGAAIPGASVAVDTGHQGTSNAQGQIQWADIPAVPLFVTVTAAHCTGSQESLTATATQILVPLTCAAPTRTLRVSVNVVGSTVPVTGAYVFLDPNHRGIVDVSGSIQWSDVPLGVLPVMITAPYCTTTQVATDASAIALAAFMPCGSPNPTGDQLDLGSATVHNSPLDTPGWPVTTQLTQLDFGNGVFINFTKRDGNNGIPRWPDVAFGTGNLEYSLWIVLNINGKWHASGCIGFWYDPIDVLRNGGYPSGFAANWYYDANRWGPMTGYQPLPGELVGFFVSAGIARNVLDDSGTLVLERSNVVLVPFPTDSGAIFNY